MGNAKVRHGTDVRASRWLEKCGAEDRSLGGAVWPRRFAKVRGGLGMWWCCVGAGGELEMM